MSINGINTNHGFPMAAAAQQAASQTQSLNELARPLNQPDAKPEGELREVFDRFVGQSFYSQLLGAMRQTVETSFVKT